MALGWGNARIAGALAISGPTLRKHYFRELRFRAEARDRVEARRVEALFGKVSEGSVPAIKELGRLIEKVDVEDDAYRPSRPREARAAKLGKKDQRHADARQVGGIYAPGPAPSRH